MTEKQIFKRMNDCYESEFGDSDFDEWYGSDDPMEWKFYRPSGKVTVLMLMQPEYKRIKLQEKRDNESEYKVIGYYEW